MAPTRRKIDLDGLVRVGVITATSFVIIGLLIFWFSRQSLVEMTSIGQTTPDAGVVLNVAEAEELVPGGALARFIVIELERPAGIIPAPPEPELDENGAPVEAAEELQAVENLPPGPVSVHMVREAWLLPGMREALAEGADVHLEHARPWGVVKLEINGVRAVNFTGIIKDDDGFSTQLLGFIGALTLMLMAFVIRTASEPMNVVNKRPDKARIDRLKRHDTGDGRPPSRVNLVSGQQAVQAETPAAGARNAAGN